MVYQKHWLIEDKNVSPSKQILDKEIETVKGVFKQKSKNCVHSVP